MISSSRQECGILGRVTGLLPAALAIWLLGGGGQALAQDKKPIIVVFNVEDKGAGLDTAMLERLSDYLAMKLAATGAFQVVPRDQIKQRLVAQKVESFKQCYAQSCQIQIGKELAAQKSLTTMVVKLGQRCMVAMVLFDLKKAASEGGASRSGGCSEDAIVANLESAVPELVPTKAKAPAPAPVPAVKPPAPRPQPAAPPELVTMDITSAPRRAVVFINEQIKGKTPVRLDLVRGKAYTLRLYKRGYHQHHQVIRPTQYANVKYNLRPTDATLAHWRHEHMTRNEWITAEPFFYVTTAGTVGGGGTISFARIKWKYFYLSVLNGGAAGGDGTFLASATTEMGFPLYLGSRGQHRLQFGLGLGFGLINNSESSQVVGFHFIPTVQYLYQSTSGAFFGGGLRAQLHGVGSIDPHRVRNLQTNEYEDQGGYTMAFLFTVPVGY